HGQVVFHFLEAEHRSTVSCEVHNGHSQGRPNAIDRLNIAISNLADQTVLMKLSLRTKKYRSLRTHRSEEVYWEVLLSFGRDSIFQQSASSSLSSPRSLKSY